MKILQINAVNEIRSTGRTCTEMADYLNANGHDCYIAYSEGPSYKKGYQIGTKFEKKMHALYSRIFGLQGYYSVYGTKKLLHYIKKIQPEIIHIRNLHSNFINLKLLCRYLLKHDIPTVVTLHDCWFFTGKCTHYTVDQCFKWQTQCGHCPRLRKDNKSWFFDRTKKMQLDKKKWLSSIPRLAIVGVSKWLTGEAKKSFLGSAKIVRHIYNWIDLDVFKPVETSGLSKKMGLEGKFIILGVASGWSNAKGLDKFIDLSAILPDDMQIILIGSINNKIKLSSKIIRFNETHDVNELVKLYSLADVFLHLSPEECCSKATVESLACGTPIIVTNYTGNPELVGEDCGFIARTVNLSEILNHLEQIKKQGKSFYATHCIEYARKHFIIRERIEEYVDLYIELLRK